MKTLATFAFLAVMAVGVSGANASSLAGEGRQNFYYYFGTPCACGAPVVAAVEAPCAVAPVNPCCCEGTGLFGGSIIEGIL